MTAPTLRPVPRRPATGPAGPTPTALQAGAPAAAWALVAGLVGVVLPVLLVWTADARSSGDALQALRTAGQVWLVAHGTPLDLDPGRLSLVPTGLVALPLAVLYRAGTHAARQHRPEGLRGAAVLTGALAGPYALVAAVVASLSSTPTARPSLPGAVVGAALVALLGAGAGTVRTAGLQGQLAAALPEGLRRLAVPAGAAVLALLGCGALLAGGALAVSAGQAADLAAAAAPGAVGGVALLLLGLLLVPGAVVWGACWWAGPGFAVGTGTHVGPLAHDLGAVPSLPLFAALPAGPLPLWLGVPALLVPVLCGALGGTVLVRRGSPRPLREAGLCGLLAGLALGLLARLTGGAAGAERMSSLGASAWQVAAAVAVEVAVGALLAVWVLGRRAARTAPPEQAPEQAPERAPERAP